MKIEAAVVRASDQPFTIEELELDEPRDNEVLVRVVATGICHTDIGVKYSAMVPQPVVLGHEGAGIVERVGSQVTKVQPGDHVVLSYFTCTTCQNCRSGHSSNCDLYFPGNFTGARLDGSHTLHKGDEPISGVFFTQSSFATYAIASSNNVVKVPSDLPLELLGPLGCGIMTGAGGVINALKATPGSSIAIFGVGSVGLSAVMAARAVGCTTVIGVDINPQRLELARELGATHTINPTEVDPVAAITEITGGGAQYSIEAIGLPETLRQAVACLRMTGVCGLIGVPKPGSMFNIDMFEILNGRTVRGIIMGDSVPEYFIPHLLDLYQQGRFPFDKMVTFYPFAQINEAIHDTETGKAVKAVLRMPN